jgi:hypothetical protein
MRGNKKRKSSGAIANQRIARKAQNDGLSLGREQRTFTRKTGLYNARQKQNSHTNNRNNACEWFWYFVD